jgi:hypothetical protein
VQSAPTDLPRVRQAVLAARELPPTVSALREKLGAAEPFSDPAVGYFGLRNAVFALGDTFLEVVSPMQPDTAAGRLLDRRGGDCGYMVMFQVADLAAARARAAGQQVREVFAVELEDMAEAHLHPADMRGAIVSLSSPRPVESWRWGGPHWRERSVGLQLAGVGLAVSDPGAVDERWSDVLGTPLGAAGVELEQDDREPGLVQIVLAAPADAQRDPFELAGVRFVFTDSGKGGPAQTLG